MLLPAVVTWQTFLKSPGILQGVPTVFCFIFPTDLERHHLKQFLGLEKWPEVVMTIQALN
jgi:hypothetical protein